MLRDRGIMFYVGALSRPVVVRGDGGIDQAGAGAQVTQGRVSRWR
jgi:hypothetical protein